MTVYVGKTGRTYARVDPFLGKGGEGAVYAIAGMPDYVLKIYLDGKATETKYRKLQAMLDTKMSDKAMQQITWPIDIVYDNGLFAGYVMPQLSGTEALNVMYSNQYRCSLLERLTIARNICVALNSVHEAGQVCGDLNPKNIAVNPTTAKVKLVDTDSYHITDHDDRVYRCEVGLPEYLPREIQEKMRHGETLATALLPTFSKASDLFALAVHIFALLMNGCHPFACAVSSSQYNIGRLQGVQRSVTAPQPIDNICSGFFPFYETRSGITTPRYAPEFDILPQDIRNLFIKAFVDGHNDPSARPNTVTWYRAIVQMQQNLKICQVNQYHMYPNTLWKCPWCSIEERMNNMMPDPVFVPGPVLMQPPVSVPATYIPTLKRDPRLRIITAAIFGSIAFLIGIGFAIFLYIIMLILSGDGLMYGLNRVWSIWATVLQTIAVAGITLYGIILGWKL